jgi:hypothetical protein
MRDGFHCIVIVPEVLSRLPVNAIWLRHFPQESSAIVKLWGLSLAQGTEEPRSRIGPELQKVPAV